MKPLLLVCLCTLCGAVVLAQRQEPNPVNPNPGGSPFAPGHEPYLTHTATAYWTTQDGLITEIEIKVEGDRPTQFACWTCGESETNYLDSSIAPFCRYHIIISSQKMDVADGILNIVGQGNGMVQVLVHGFKREDFTNPPLVTASYKKDGKPVGETRVTPKPIPKKLK